MEWNTPPMKAFIAAILALKTPEEARRFLRDLLTEGEIEEFAKRLQAARMLAARMSYPQIQAATSLSQTTIARVSKWLQEGEGGYRLVIERLHHHWPPSGRGAR